MKAALIAMVFTASLWVCIRSGGLLPTQGKRIAFTGPDTNYFKTRVQPLLQKNCSPCHFPGGKLYEKLPFDKAETIIDHAAAALKRFKDENEMIVIKEFVRQHTVAK